MTHEQSQLLLLVKSSIGNATLNVDSKQLPAQRSWAQASWLRQQQPLFISKKVWHSLYVPAVALQTQSKGLCQRLYSPSPASPAPAQPSQPLAPVSPRQSQALPSLHRRTCITAQCSLAAVGMLKWTQGCFRLNWRAELPAQGITWHRYARLFPASQEETFDDFSELNINIFFLRTCCWDGWLQPALKMLLT